MGLPSPSEENKEEGGPRRSRRSAQKRSIGGTRTKGTLGSGMPATTPEANLGHSRGEAFEEDDEGGDFNEQDDELEIEGFQIPEEEAEAAAAAAEASEGKPKRRATPKTKAITKSGGRKKKVEQNYVRMNLRKGYFQHQRGAVRQAKAQLNKRKLYMRQGKRDFRNLRKDSRPAYEGYGRAGLDGVHVSASEQAKKEIVPTFSAGYIKRYKHEEPEMRLLKEK